MKQTWLSWNEKKKRVSYFSISNLNDTTKKVCRKRQNRSKLGDNLQSHHSIMWFFPKNKWQNWIRVHIHSCPTPGMHSGLFFSHHYCICVQGYFCEKRGKWGQGKSGKQARCPQIWVNDMSRKVAANENIKWHDESFSFPTFNVSKSMIT